MRIVKSLLGLVLFEETDSFGPFFPVVAPATALGCVATCAGRLRGPPAGSMRDMGERGAAGRRGYQGGCSGRAGSRDAQGRPAVTQARGVSACGEPATPPATSPGHALWLHSEVHPPRTPGPAGPSVCPPRGLAFLCEQRVLLSFLS